MVGEAHFRSPLTRGEPQQVLLRPGIGFKLSPGLSLSLGYTNMFNWKPDSLLPISRRENNIWQEVKFLYQPGKLKSWARLRIEQRFIKSYSVAYPVNSEIDTTTVFENRYTTRGRLQIGLSRKINDRFSITGLNEFWMNFAPNKFDQNWTLLGLNYFPSKDFRIQLGYLFRIQNRSELQASNILRLAIFHTIDYKKRAKKSQ